MSSDTWFVNAVVEIKTKLSAHELLDTCKRIEAQLGRKNSGSGRITRTALLILIFFFMIKR